MEIDNIQVQQDLAEDLIKILDFYRGRMTYSTVLGVIEVIKHTILLELEDECNDKDLNYFTLFEGITKTSNGGIKKSPFGD